MKDVTFHRLNSLVRRLVWGLALFGLLGCAVFQPGGAEAPATAPASLPTHTVTATLLALSPTFTPALPASATPTLLLPTLTFTAPPPPVPTLTPFPSLTPQPVFDPAMYTPTATAAASSGGKGQCCTLRVRNGGPITYWVGKKLPKNGSMIKPRWYIEFYLDEPDTMTVYWCLWVNRTEFPDNDSLGAPARGSDNLFDCRQRDVYVPEGITEIYIQ